jgi:hypothetical protein
LAQFDGNGRVFLVGRWFTPEEMGEIQDVVGMFSKLSRTELACTVCECVGWVSPSGEPKRKSGERLLELLEEMGLLTAPKATLHVQKERGPGRTELAEPGDEIVESSVGKLGRIICRPTANIQESHLWNEYVERYHILGYKRPFGAHMRYFIELESGTKLGCFLFSASAWALEKRDEWIGWDATHRSQRLNYITNNTRFLILPWVKVKNLASRALSVVAKRLAADWETRYGYSPVLLETFVDTALYNGACYRAANWIYLGETAGRGRMDRHTKYLSSPKSILVYPLHKGFRDILNSEVTWPNGQTEGQDEPC